MIRIIVKKIEPLTNGKRFALLSALSENALSRLNKKRNGKLYLASICALSLLTDEQLSDLAYAESGRPFFRTLDADISVSHSKAYAAIALSDSKDERVGIDIEDVRSKTDSFSRFLTENELKALENGASHIELWTKKEALFKYLKNDSLILPQTDSSAPERYGAAFTAVQTEDSILTVCAPRGSKIDLIRK